MPIHMRVWMMMVVMMIYKKVHQRLLAGPSGTLGTQPAIPTGSTPHLLLFPQKVMMVMMMVLWIGTSLDILFCTLISERAAPVPFKLVKVFWATDSGLFGLFRCVLGLYINSNSPLISDNVWWFRETELCFVSKYFWVSVDVRNFERKPGPDLYLGS